MSTFDMELILKKIDEKFHENAQLYNKRQEENQENLKRLITAATQESENRLATQLELMQLSTKQEVDRLKEIANTLNQQMAEFSNEIAALKSKVTILEREKSIAKAENEIQHQARSLYVNNITGIIPALAKTNIANYPGTKPQAAEAVEGYFKEKVKATLDKNEPAPRIQVKNVTFVSNKSNLNPRVDTNSPLPCFIELDSPENAKLFMRTFYDPNNPRNVAQPLLKSQPEYLEQQKKAKRVCHLLKENKVITKYAIHPRINRSSGKVSYVMAIQPTNSGPEGWIRDQQTVLGLSMKPDDVNNYFQQILSHPSINKMNLLEEIKLQFQRKFVATERVQTRQTTAKNPKPTHKRSTKAQL